MSPIADDGHPNERPRIFAESDDGTGFDLEVSELEREMSGLRTAIRKGGDDGAEQSDDGDGDELRVEQLDGLLLRMQAIKGEFCLPSFRTEKPSEFIKQLPNN